VRFIPDPDLDFLPIPNPGVKKARDPEVKKARDPEVKKGTGSRIRNTVPKYGWKERQPERDWRGVVWLS
jgi:hypothetical protein